MEQILQIDKNKAFISMDEYLDLLKMKKEILKQKKIITFEIDKDIFHTNTIKFAYITKDDAISKISDINNKLNDEVINLRSIIKSNNDKFNNIESQNRDLSAKLYNLERTTALLTNEKEESDKVKDVYCLRCSKLESEISEKEIELAYLKDMNIFEFLKYKSNKNKTK